MSTCNNKDNNLTISEKAKILENLIAYAKQFSQNIGHDFTDIMILLTAITGTAATEIGGCTSASALGFLQRTEHNDLKDIQFSMIPD